MMTNAATVVVVISIINERAPPFHLDGSATALAGAALVYTETLIITVPSPSFTAIATRTIIPEPPTNNTLPSVWSAHARASARTVRPEAYTY